MCSKKEAPAGAGTPTGAEEKGSRTAATISNSDFITSEESGQGIISPLLGAGKAAAVPLSHLVKVTGEDNRTVRLWINQERLSGVPILSDNANGYYLPGNEDEKRECVRSLRHRAGEILRVAQAIEKSGGNIT